jgi:hypothetical protein
MPIFEWSYGVNLGPRVAAEMRRLREKGCTKSDHNLNALAYRNVVRRRFFSL